MPRKRFNGSGPSLHNLLPQVRGNLVPARRLVNLRDCANSPRKTAVILPVRRTSPPRPDSPESVVQKAPQLARSRRVLELAQGLGLDLADALAGDRELLADLFERMVGIH